MIKSVLSGSFGFNDPVAVIMPLHRAGLDHGWSEKRAAAPLFDFSKIAELARPDEELVHLLALGDGETVGANRNGDYFPKVANQKYHSTFLKAHYFHNHANKDPKQAFGRVIAAAHNEPMGRVELVIGIDSEKGAQDLADLEKDGEFPCSMSCRVPFDICFPSNTPVLTEYGELPISVVKVGDRVLTHEGRWREVTAVSKRKFSGEKISLVIRGLARQLHATYNHPVLVVREAHARACRGSVDKKKRRHTYNGSDTCVTCSATIPRTSWVEAKNVCSGDYVLFPRTLETSDTVLTEDECWLLGLYLGDGCVFGTYGGRKHDLSWTSEGIAFACHSEDHAGIVTRLERLGAKQYQDGKDRRALSLVLRDRRLARLFVMQAGAGCKEKFVPPLALHWPASKRLALLAGLLDSDGSVDPTSGGARLVTTNEQLTLGFAQLCNSLGLPATTSRQKITSGFSNKPTTVWIAALPAAAAAQIGASEKIKSSAVKDQRVETQLLVTDLFVGFPVISRRRTFVEYIDVHNIEVDEDESYIASSCVVHNCMICGNQAKTREEYCKHAATMMGRIMSDGKVACVRNDHPNFFDISKVQRGADRVAFTFNRLQKAAAEGQTLGGAELAELLGAVDTLAPVARSAYVQQKRAALSTMAAALSRTDLWPVLSAALGSNMAPEQLQILKSASDLDATRSALHRAGICLSLPDFLALHGIEKPADVSDQNIHARVHSLLTADNDRLCENGAYDETTRAVSVKAATIIRELQPNFSLFSASAHHRALTKVAGAGPQHFVIEKSAGCVSPQAEVLATEYAAYLISFAQRAGAEVLEERELVQNLTALRALG